MSHPEYCAYPPKLAREVEIASEVDGAKTNFVIGSSEIGRYLKIGLVEHRVIELLDGTAGATAICAEAKQRYSLALNGATLTRFLSKLDDTGILEGKRRHTGPANINGNGLYWKWSLVNPDTLFTRVMPAIRWIWTAPFLAGSLVLLAASAAIALTNRAEIANYGGPLLRSHYAAVLIVTWIVAITHEFAHGLTAKAFGGRATEVGALLIYYCVPALYCNVSGMYLIPERHRRLWVIAAGLYWQLLVAASGLLAWFLLAPYTWQADFAMTLVLGSVLDVIFNANPLIKLDGYYFLSQWLRMPNLMDRSREYWTQLIGNIAKSSRQTEKIRPTSRERRIYLLFGAFSFFYRVAFVSVIVWYTAQYLIDRFALYGVLLSMLVVLAMARTFLKRRITAALCAMKSVKGNCSEDKKVMNGEAPQENWRRCNWRGMLALSIAMMAVLTLCIPWPASVGSYGTLLLRPENEATVRAPENGSLVLVDIRPGQHVERGAPLARLGNLDLDEQIVEVQAELARVNADEKQLSGELGVEQHEARSAALRSKQRSREFIEVEAEERQIEARLRSDPAAKNVRLSLAKDGDDSVELNISGQESLQFPAAVAALEAQADVRHVKLLEAKSELQRSRRLFAEDILPRSDLETATAEVSTLEPIGLKPASNFKRL